MNILLLLVSMHAQAAVCTYNSRTPEQGGNRREWVLRKLCIDTLQTPRKISVEDVDHGLAFYRVTSVSEVSTNPNVRQRLVYADHVSDPARWLEVRLVRSLEDVPLNLSGTDETGNELLADF